MQNFILDVIPIIQLWALENKSAIDISDQKLKKVLSKLKTEQQLVNKIEGQELYKGSDDDKAKAFDFVIESQKSEVTVGKKGFNKKGEKSDKRVREGKEKGVKETRDFMRPEQENLKDISEENRNLSGSSNTETIKEANSLDNMGVTIRTEPIPQHKRSIIALVKI